MPHTRRPFPSSRAVLAVLAAVAVLFSFTLAACGSAEAPKSTESPYDVARDVRAGLDAETALVQPRAHDEEFLLGWCRAAKFDPPSEETYVVTGRYVFTVAGGTDVAEANAPVEALYDRWLAAGWGAELHFGDSGLARATATDPGSGYAYAASPDLTWTRLQVFATSPCYAYPEGKARGDYGDLAAHA